MYDLIIIGSGPAGLGAAIYAERAQLNAITIEKEMMSGGQVLTTYSVDNYPGFPGINGFDLGLKLREHAESLGAHFVEDEVQAIGVEDGVKLIKCAKETYEAKTLLIATGARHRKLGVDGEERLGGRGVSYCAVCDGALYKNQVTAVVGGGDVAVEDAIFLSRLCKKVYLIHRRDELRAAKSLQKQLEACENIEVLWDTVVEKINGEEVVESINVKNLLQNKDEVLPIDGLFIAVGISPNSDVFLDVVEMEHGYIKAGEDCETSVPGIFAAGDVRTKALRQIVTAVADGANAVGAAERYLREQTAK
ncbi:thioredoxin-disulfide reductase [Hominifimenecus sp. rT4P-3]|uniref:thioredoxin-disulfide reductase n=1 Tax=Hominifimenecus sp. rT4P-3 TaxID=3242979 RepID=UPI003DA30461